MAEKPINCPACRCEDDLPDATLPACLHQNQKATHIHVGVERGVGHGAPHVHLGRVMAQHVEPFAADEIGRFARPDVKSMEWCPVADILFATARHIVDRKSTRLNSSHVAISYA